jgi:hypothetical protein
LGYSLGDSQWLRQQILRLYTLHFLRGVVKQAKDPSETPILHKNGMVYRIKSFGQVNKNNSTTLLRIKVNGDNIEDL